MSPRSGWDNREAAHRHAWHAMEDFESFRHRLSVYDFADKELLHSISHHLRHAAYRTGLEVAGRHVRRSSR